MELLPLLGTHWFELLQSSAIVAGFIYTARAYSLDWRSRRATTVIKLASAHRKIWSNALGNPALQRLLEAEPDLNSQPVTEDEEHFALLVLLHLDSVHQAIELKLIPRWPGLEKDIQGFFSLPIPRVILNRYLPLQRPQFRSYLQRILQL